MRDKTQWLLRTVLALLAVPVCFGDSASAAPILFSIGGDSYGSPIRVTKLDTGTGQVTQAFDLQTNSGGFSGLTYRNSDKQLYSVMLGNDGSSKLVSFSPTGSGSFIAVMDLMDPALASPMSFNGGLVYDGNDNNFYSLANDSLGNSSLYRINVSSNSVQQLTGRLPQSFNGGLTLRTDGTLGAIQNDTNGNSYIYSFDLFANSASASLLYSSSIGTGFYGGISEADGSLYALQSDNFGASSLFLIDANGHAVNLFAVGDGFLNAGLTAVPNVAPVPEPSTLLLSLSGCLLLLAFHFKTKRKHMSTILKTLLTLAVCSAPAFAQYSTPTRIVNANTQPVPVLSTAAQNAFGIDFPFSSGNGNNRIDFSFINAPAGKRIVIDMISMSATLPSNNEIYVPCLAQLPSGSYTTTASFPVYVGDTRIKEIGSQPVKIYGDAVVCGILRSDVLNTASGTVTVVGHYEPII